MRHELIIVLQSILTHRLDFHWIQQQQQQLAKIQNSSLSATQFGWHTISYEDCCHYST